MMHPDARLRISDWMERLLGCPVTLISMVPLKGGGIQENWTIDALVGSVERSFVLRKDAPSTIEASHSRKNEFDLLQVAFDAGVTVPEPIGFCGDVAVLGGPFAMMAKVAGTGLGPKVVKELRDEDRTRLTERLARELGRIHAISPGGKSLQFLGKPPADFAVAEIAQLRGWIDRLGIGRPGLEWAMRWCELHIPKNRDVTLVHRDFRTGNYMVDNGELTAVLDWEFATWGDPMFDIGWFLAECWRFGRPDLEAGGIGHRAVFYAAYEDETGRSVDDAAVRAYEILAHCRWAVIALLQGERHASGREASLEHALTGRMAEELELAALRMTSPERWRLRHDGGLGA